MNKEDFLSFCEEIESGKIRVAEKVGEDWLVNTEVKEKILEGFRIGTMQDMTNGAFPFFDKDTIPIRKFTIEDKIRIVPGGSSVRRGSYISPSVIIMPPSYINIGAYIGENTLIDSHALVGSCAQVGANVHLSAASQLGGVLEPIGALPVIVEDNVFIGGNCGIYEGTIIKEKAVIATGVILNRATSIYDAVNECFISANEKGQLIVPQGAVVVSGSRPIRKGKAEKEGIQVYCPVIIKYRDDKTDTSIQIEQFLR